MTPYPISFLLVATISLVNLVRVRVAGAVLEFV